MQIELEFDQPTKKPKSEKRHSKASSGESKSVSVTALTSGDSDRAQTPTEKKFHKLWNQLDALQQRNLSFDALYEKTRNYLQTELTESRAAYRNALVNQTTRLIEHLKKKSLTQWQRTELRNWIEQNLSQLDMQGASEVEALAQSYNEANMAAFLSAHKSKIEQQLDMTVEEFAEAVKYADEIADEYDDDDDWAYDEQFDDSLFDDEPAKDDSHYYREQSSATDEKQRQQTQESRAHIDKTVINKLFRKTARALHPDHEQNPERREAKQALMKTLLKARDTGDVITIFALYQEHVSSEEMQVELPELKPLITLLQNRLNQLEVQYSEMVQRSPTHQWVHSYLVDKNEQQQAIALGTLKRDVEDDLQNIEKLMPHLKTLKSLKPLLEIRYDQGRFYY